jgi:hypothetical protein
VRTPRWLTITGICLFVLAVVGYVLTSRERAAPAQAAESPDREQPQSGEPAAAQPAAASAAGANPSAERPPAPSAWPNGMPRLKAGAARR